MSTRIVIFVIALSYLLSPIYSHAEQQYKLYIESYQLNKKDVVKYDPQKWMNPVFHQFGVKTVMTYPYEKVKVVGKDPATGAAMDAMGYRDWNSGHVFLNKKEDKNALVAVLTEFSPKKLAEMFHSYGVKLDSIELTLKIAGGAGEITRFVIDFKGEAGLKVVLKPEIIKTKQNLSTQ